MNGSSVKQQLLADFFANYPMGGALYDSSGLLIEINKAMSERFALSGKSDFILNSLFESDYLSDLQKEHLSCGSVISETEPIGFTIIPTENNEGDRIGYTLLLAEAMYARSDQGESIRDMEDMSEKVAASVPDTILLVNSYLIVERVIAYAAETCITPEAINRRIDDLPGFIYPNETKHRMAAVVQKCLDEDEVINIELSIPGHNVPVVYFKLRMVPMHHKYVVIYIRNISDLMEKEKENKDLSNQLSESRTMMELALVNSKIATFSFSFDRFKSCDKVNCNRCFQFFGMNNSLLNRNKFICRSLCVLRDPEDRQDFFLLFNEIRNKKLAEHKVAFRLKNDDGMYRSYEVIGKPMELDVDGTPNLIVGCIIDNQERVEYEESLIQAKEKAEKADLLKSTFLANMTHEIRTPLNAIVGFSDLLCIETDAEMRENYINLIKTNNEQLLNLINDVLDISRIEADMLTFAYADTYLPAMMKDLYNLLDARLKEQVALILDPCEEYVFNIDKNRLIQILYKLLSNALKHTAKGHIRFGYKLRSDDIYFYVEDTGTGISKDNLTAIFGRFVQLNGFEQGVGLGLPICKGLVTKMGGELRVESEIGRGSTFSFTLPLSRPNSWK